MAVSFKLTQIVVEIQSL